MGLAALDRCAEQVLRSQLGVSVAGLPRVLWTMKAMACIIAIARKPARGKGVRLVRHAGTMIAAPSRGALRRTGNGGFLDKAETGLGNVR